MGRYVIPRIWAKCPPPPSPLPSLESKKHCGEIEKTEGGEDGWTELENEQQRDGGRRGEKEKEEISTTETHR